MSALHSSSITTQSLWSCRPCSTVGVHAEPEVVYEAPQYISWPLEREKRPPLEEDTGGCQRRPLGVVILSWVFVSSSGAKDNPRSHLVKNLFESFLKKPSGGGFRLPITFLLRLTYMELSNLLLDIRKTTKLSNNFLGRPIFKVLAGPNDVTDILPRHLLESQSLVLAEFEPKKPDLLLFW